MTESLQKEGTLTYLIERPLYREYTPPVQHNTTKEIYFINARSMNYQKIERVNQIEESRRRFV